MILKVLKTVTVADVTTAVKR